MAKTFQELNETIDKIGVAFEEFKKANDDRLKAVKDGNESKAGELDQKLGRISLLNRFNCSI